jgi:hypothetical protein
VSWIACYHTARLLTAHIAVACMSRLLSFAQQRVTGLLVMKSLCVA